MAIVVGYLATQEGRAALETAAEEAQRRNERLVVVVSGRGDETDEQRGELDVALDGVRAELDARGVAHEVRVLTRGRDVAEDLIGTAEEVRAALIVIGLRRRSPIGKLILGANAQRILLDAPCPVLAVKPAAPSPPRPRGNHPGGPGVDHRSAHETLRAQPARRREHLTPTPYPQRLCASQAVRGRVCAGRCRYNMGAPLI
jgi:nucleotide-binding universal stress UspA family protein